jgi:uncharacterized integral membrane protein
MQWLHMAGIFVLSVVTLVFAVQNFESVTLDFLGISVSAPSTSCHPRLPARYGHRR